MTRYGKMVVCGGRSNPRLTAGVCDYLKIPVTDINFVDFSNGNIKVTVGENVREADVFVFQSGARGNIDNRFFTELGADARGQVLELFRECVEKLANPTRQYALSLIKMLGWIPNIASLLCNKDFMELLIIVDALKGASANRITVVMPYYFYARSDKKVEGRISITAKLVADLLEMAGAHRILAMDLHAAQIQGFFDPRTFDHIYAAPLFYQYIREQGRRDWVVALADDGRIKNAQKIAIDLGLAPDQLVIVHKFRPDDTESPLLKETRASITGRHCIMWDDEILKGSTNIGAAEQLDGLGAASIYSFVAHLVASDGAGERLEVSPITQLVTTNTVAFDGVVPSKVKVLDAAPIFARTIRRIHDGRPVSALIEDLKHRSLTGKLF
ncbi:MAG: ribose-phosphate pyrophosphokinase [Patescibacteria group bacterium]|nr:ribose-phosphate pyrophosphokinase [Patescibacteria group bacterium]MDD5715899.1 ribose-phosphate pyrophosphokinase [Patescibacteria group bacterium]